MNEFKGETKQNFKKVNADLNEFKGEMNEFKQETGQNFKKVFTSLDEIQKEIKSIKKELIRIEKEGTKNTELQELTQRVEILEISLEKQKQEKARC